MQEPMSFKLLICSWRVTNKVMKNTNIGEVEFKTLAKPLSIYCWPHTRIVHAPMELKMAWMKSIFHVFGSRGSFSPRQWVMNRSKIAAMVTRVAIRVKGGISATAIFMNV